VSFTLKGRLETRLAASLVPFLVACGLALGLREWWPLQRAAIMTGVGLALDATLYHRLLPYQPGWAALPLGALELAATMSLVLALHVPAPLAVALGIFGLAWLWTQILAHACFPLLELSYAEDGGELRRAGPVAAGGVAAILALTGGVAWATRPPVVHLHGVVRGPLVLDHEQTVIGGVVRGGIVITADGVTLKHVSTIGGDYGIEIRQASRVRLEDVSVLNAREDGIHARRSGVVIDGCAVNATPGTQAIDISFAMHEMSDVSGCTVTGGSEGIVVHFTMAHIHDNRVTGTLHRAITMTEMSMGDVSDNDIVGAHDTGVYCGDYSECHVEDNTIVGPATSIVANYGASARVRRNEVDGRVRAIVNSELTP
jgi:nitrous oxidase accessory protein NosD